MNARKNERKEECFRLKKEKKAAAPTRRKGEGGLTTDEIKEGRKQTDGKKGKVVLASKKKGGKRPNAWTRGGADNGSTAHESGRKQRGKPSTKVLPNPEKKGGRKRKTT